MLYHGTSIGGLRGILEEGCMIPNQLNSSRAVEEGWAEAEDHEGFVFFTDSLSDAIHYSAYAIANGKNTGFDGVCVVLCVNTNHHELELVSESSHLKEYRHKGNVKREAIREVWLCSFEEEKTVIKTSLDNWQQALKEQAHLFN